MFYSRICILTNETVTPLQMEEFQKEVSFLMQNIFDNKIEVEVVLDVLKKKEKRVKKMEEEEMDVILERFNPDERYET